MKGTPSFGEPPGDDAIAGERAGLLGIGTVKLERTGRLVGHFHEFRNRGLHPKRHFVLRDPGLRLRVAEVVEVLVVEGCDAVEHAATHGAVDAGGVLKIQDRFGTLAKLHALVLARAGIRLPTAARRGPACRPVPAKSSPHRPADPCSDSPGRS